MTNRSISPNVPCCAQGPAESRFAPRLSALGGEVSSPGPGATGQISGGLAAPDPETIDDLRRVFENRGFTQAALRDALGRDPSQLMARGEIPLFERRLAESTPLHTLLKLFTLQLWVDEPAVREAFSPISLEHLLALGLVRLGGHRVQSVVGLSFCDNLRLFHDPAVEAPHLLRPDHVLGLSPSALTLANLTVRSHGGRALDVGTGCGVQALLAAGHCQEVIATDTNPRALAYTRFNARFNRRGNIECRLGSLFEPVAGCKFDLVICNPPFVISPESEYQFRDSGQPADRLSELVIRAAPEFLNEGGFASILCSWAHYKDEDWSTRPREWTKTSGCDVCLLRGETHDPLGHAALWNEGYGPAALGQRLDRWQAYYQRLGIKALSVGAVLLRRRSAARHWTRTDEMPRKFAGSCGEHILRVTQAEDLLADLSSDDALFDQVFTLPPDHRLHQVMVHQQGRFDLQKTEIELNGGLGFRGNLDPATFELLKRCDGQRSLRSILTELAHLGKTSFEQVRPQANGAVRTLIRCGLLVPISGRQAGVADPSSGGCGAAAQINHAPNASPGVLMEVSHE